MHDLGIAAIDARDRGDMVEMLKHVEAMERASVRVIDGLDRMADSVALERRSVMRLGGLLLLLLCGHCLADGCDSLAPRR